MTRPLVALVVLVGLVGGCAATLDNTPCDLRDQNLVGYWWMLKQMDGNTTDGKHLAGRFLMRAIEQEVPVQCWRELR